MTIATEQAKNPLLSNSWLPHFQQISAQDVEPAIRQILAENQAEFQKLLQMKPLLHWEQLMQPLDELDERLGQAWSPIAHLHAVRQEEALRNAYNTCLPLITEYHTAMLQSPALYAAIEALANQPGATFDFAQKKVLENALRDFRLAGVHLSAEQKATFLELEKKLSQLTTQFSENLLDATQAWFLPIDDQKQLAGLPAYAIELMKQNAQQRQRDGWALTLDYPSYLAGMKFLDDRQLRATLYQAYTTRASDQGSHDKRWDNSKIMDEILACRQQLAQLLGFANFAEYSLTTKMAKHPASVMEFLQTLLNKCKPFAEKEMRALKKFAHAQGGPAELAPWDFSYYAEKYRQATFNFTEEDIKPYFPIDKVIHGLFTLVNKIYGLTIEERFGVEVWHPEVRFFDIVDSEQNHRGGFYIDLYARARKREGAWMDDCRMRRKRADNSLQLPVAYLICNFTPPLGTTPALLTHDEVLTLFHEFGHCLHHVLTTINYPAVSGTHGVPWDAVEFPSQFMELFFWEKEVLELISGHYQSGAPLPSTLHQQLVAAKNFHAGIQMVRQMELALFDFRIHLEYSAQPDFIQTILDQVRAQTALLPIPAFNRFQHSFAHIFAGGYAAGYYSYSWADVLSCDAYGQFVENGLLNRAVGDSFLHAILEKGGACDPLEAFITFRGRKPELTALLQQNGWESR